MTSINFKRKWIKLWIDECLTGTIREDLSPDERSVWYDFLIFSGKNRPAGCVSANEDTPISRKRLAAILNIPLPLLNRSIKRFEKSGRIEIDLKGIIHIVNWSKYQFTDYDRQKPYRQKKHHLEAAQALRDNPVLGYGEDLGYTYEMFCEDYDALNKTGGLGDDLATSQYFWNKYGWSKTDMKGTKICRLFMSAFNAIKANDESNPDNPDDEQVVRETLASLQS